MLGFDLKILQPINPENKEPIGEPFFAADPLGVALEEIVAYEESFQATLTTQFKFCIITDYIIIL